MIITQITTFDPTPTSVPIGVERKVTDPVGKDILKRFRKLEDELDDLGGLDGRCPDSYGGYPKLRLFAPKLTKTKLARKETLFQEILIVEGEAMTHIAEVASRLPGGIVYSAALSEPNALYVGGFWCHDPRNPWPLCITTHPLHICVFCGVDACTTRTRE